MGLTISKRWTPGCLTILVDGEEWAQLDPKLYRKVDWPKVCHSLDEWKERFDDILRHAAKLYGVRLLSQRAVNSEQFRDKLLQKGFPEVLVEALLAEFEQAGYVSDYDWAESYYRGLQRKRYGPAAIRQRMRQKGVPAPIIEELMEQSDTDVERESIQELLETRYRNRNFKDLKERQKVMASLVRRGFSVGTASQVLMDAASE